MVVRSLITIRADARFNLQDVLPDVRRNCEPDDVFTIAELVKWVRLNKNPENVYAPAQLARWARKNGYRKEA